MKTLLAAPLALLGLSGCVAYTPYGYGPGYGYDAPYTYSGPSVYVQPGVVYSRPAYPRRGLRDQDGDGRANRYDRDRDGDGTPNRFDRRPGDPRRR